LDSSEVTAMYAVACGSVALDVVLLAGCFLKLAESDAARQLLIEAVSPFEPRPSPAVLDQHRLAVST
jgi:hypothetical protein